MRTSAARHGFTVDGCGIFDMTLDTFDTATDADRHVDGGAGLNGAARVPRHVAIIMDGNARWAAARGLPVAQGHRAGYENIERVTRALAAHGVEEATLFAFSTENWNRPEAEVDALMNLASEAISSGVARFHENGVRLRHVGNEDRLPDGMMERIKRAELLTSGNDQLALNLAFDYGGRHEIVNAVRAIVADGIAAEAVDEALIERYLFTAGAPDPDMVIRTGGEQRISNFMIWEAAYAEFYTSEAMWPEFGDAEVAEAIAAYARRQRRFGKRPT